MTTNQHYPTYYETSIHDKTESFLYNAIQGSGKLSEGACDDIRKLFEDEMALLKFIQAYVDVDNVEAWALIDQVFPEPCDRDLKWVDLQGLPRLNARALM
jgi:hypothetical protein